MLIEKDIRDANSNNLLKLTDSIGNVPHELKKLIDKNFSVS
jgi:hypothetical protein